MHGKGSRSISPFVLKAGLANGYLVVDSLRTKSLYYYLAFGMRTLTSFVFRVYFSTERIKILVCCIGPSSLLTIQFVRYWAEIGRDHIVHVICAPYTQCLSVSFPR